MQEGEPPCPPNVSSSEEAGKLPPWMHGEGNDESPKRFPSGLATPSGLAVSCRRVHRALRGDCSCALALCVAPMNNRLELNPVSELL